MKKIYAQQVNPEHFNFDVYYSEEDAYQDMFWAGGNSRLIEINSQLIEGLDDRLNDIRYEAFNKKDNVTLKEIVFNYLTKANGSEFNEIESEKIFNLANDFYNSKSYEENEILCSVLELIYGESFITGIIRGCCQGDWLEYICPERLKDCISYIEAVLFNTGTEYRVTEDTYEEEPDYLDVPVIYVYTEKWRPEDVKQVIASEVGVSVDEVVVKVITKSYVVHQFEYGEL